MQYIQPLTKTISLNSHGITSKSIYYQLSADELQAKTIALGQGTEAASGALAIRTGEFTGRSPKDRFIVKDALTKDHVWWGEVNLPFSPNDFDHLYDKVTAYLSKKELYVRDSYVCADPNHRVNVRVINEFPWSNYFAYNMFLRPEPSELEDFSQDWTVINAPGFRANPEEDATR